MQDRVFQAGARGATVGIGERVHRAPARVAEEQQAGGQVFGSLLGQRVDRRPLDVHIGGHRVGDGLEDDLLAVPAVTILELAFAVEHGLVGVDAVAAEGVEAGDDARLVAEVHSAVALQCLAKRAGSGLCVGDALAAALRAQALAQGAQRIDPQGAVVAGGVAAYERQPGGQGYEFGDGAGDRVDEMTPGGHHLLGVLGPVPAVGRECLAGRLELDRSGHVGGDQFGVAAASAC